MRPDARASRFGRRLAVLALVVGTAACGNGGDTEEVRSDARVVGRTSTVAGLAGIELSAELSSDVIPIGDGGAAVVDGAAATDSGRRLQVTSVLDGTKRVSVAGGLPPLIFPSAWWHDGSVYVYGHECPKVDVTRLEDYSDFGPERFCGPGYADVVRALDVRSGEWTVVVDDLPAEPGDQLFFAAAHGMELVLSTANENPYLYVDLAKGRSEPISDIRRSDVTCPVLEGGFLVAGRILNPAGDGSGPSTTQPGPPAAVGAWRVRDGSATPLVGAVPVGFEPALCLPDGSGFLGRDPGRPVPLLRVASGDRLTTQPDVALPPGAADPYTSIWNYGTEVILWTTVNAATPDATSEAWRLNDDLSWTQVGGTSRVPVPSRATAVLDDSILSVVRSTTSTAVTVEAIT